MADYVSKIKLPSGDIKNLAAYKMKPLRSKTFEGVWSTTLETSAAKTGTTGGSTDSRDYLIYMGKIKICGIDKTSSTTIDRTWTQPWHVKLRMHSYCPTQANNYDSWHILEIYGSGTTITYKNQNMIYSSTVVCYDFLNRLKSTGLKSTTLELEQLWGINFYSTSSSGSNNSSYKRTFEIDVLEEDNCEFTFLDDWQSARHYHADNSSWLNTTNYYGYINSSNAVVDCTNMNTSSNGLQETGDADTTGYFYYYSPLQAGPRGIKGYTIVAQRPDGRWGSLTTDRNTCSASVVKTVNDQENFVLGGPVLYFATNTNYNENTYTAVNAFWSHYAFDTRYISNYYGTSASSYPTKAFAYSGSGTTAAYSRAWIKVSVDLQNKTFSFQSLLLNDTDRDAQGEGYYMLVGSNYSSIGEYYRIATFQNPRIYYIDSSRKMKEVIASKTVFYDNNDNVTIPGTLAIYDDIDQPQNYESRRPVAKFDTSSYDWDVYFFNSGIAAYNADLDQTFKYSYPAATGTIALQETLTENALPIIAGNSIYLSSGADGLEVSVNSTSSVTSGSTALVTSGAVYSAIQSAITTALNTSV